MNPYYQDDWVTIYHGDCRDVLPSLPKASAIVTDPPYGLGFMGREWDTYDPTVNRGSFRVGTGTHPRGYAAIKKPAFQEFCYQWATACLQATLTGAPMLAFGGTRTFHRMACAIEDAGWELRDTLGWIYFQGFPKALDIGKAVDKALGAKRQDLGSHPTINGRGEDNFFHGGFNPEGPRLTAPATPEAQLWEGYRTSLKPAYEPIILAMSPLDGTFAHNALTHGVAGLNIGECRIPLNGDRKTGGFGDAKSGYQKGIGNSGDPDYKCKWKEDTKDRFPPNLIIDDSPEVAGIFPNSKGGAYPRERGKSHIGFAGGRLPGDPEAHRMGDNGSATRFFYCAKASKSERDRGCEDMPETPFVQFQTANGTSGKPSSLSEGRNTRYRNDHPTIKPLALMTYLVKLVKMPEYNLVVDPFCGTGTTLMACIRLGIPCIGVDNDEHTCEIAALRCVRETETQAFRKEEQSYV